jgi:predicted ArsR family transcriptional regulator
MSTPCETSDARLLELLRVRGSASVAEAAEAGGVTATAVRQRLTRLTKQGLIERVTQRHGRGRPEHRYSLTEKARRQAGNNYADLALVLWKELREVKDADVRRGLLQRIADHMTRLYADSLNGSTPQERMESLRALFADRRVPVEVGGGGTTASLPVLTVVDCPYPELAAQDRGICAMEKMMFEDLVEQPLTLSQCRLDGHNCCQFQAK